MQKRSNQHGVSPQSQTQLIFSTTRTIGQFSSITVNNINTQINNRTKQINEYTMKIANINGVKYMQTSHKNNIIQQCSSLKTIAPVVKSAIQGLQLGQGQYNKEDEFWHHNQQLEKQLEVQLRKLKDIDVSIDNIVNEQFDKCNEMDEIEETIRIILSKKQKNHIQNAEPYYQHKQSCVEFLRSKGLQKQNIKQLKLAHVNKILKLLQTLRKHRKDGLKYFTKQQQVGTASQMSQEQTASMLSQTIQSLNQIKNNEQKIPLMRQQQLNMLKSANRLQSQHNIQITKLTQSLMYSLGKQNQLCLQLDRIWSQRTYAQFYGSVFLETIGLKATHITDHNHAFSKLITKLQKYMSAQKQKMRHISKIQQGIQTTDKTIEIFGHIMNKIQTENMRRKELLQYISQIQHQHQQQSNSREMITEVQTDIQKLLVKKNRLAKNLSNKIDEADVSAYKSIHQQIQLLNQQIQNRQKQVSKTRNRISQNAKLLYDDTINLQQEYSDILSEIVPNYWFRDNDFTKQETIKDLNLYLMKTFKRMSIAD